MSISTEPTHADPLADTSGPTPARLSATTRFRLKPGSQVLLLCLIIDGLLIALVPAGRWLTRSTLLEPVVNGAIYGILAAQFAMAAIWLGVIATALYWMLAGLVVFCVTVLAFSPAPVSSAWLLNGAMGALAFALPFALVNLAGFRLEERCDVLIRDYAPESFRFPLSHLFAWTFVVAALLGVAQWLPAAVTAMAAISLAFLLVALVSLANMWAVLSPGQLPRWIYFAPFAALTLVAVVGQWRRGWSGAVTASFIAGAASFIVTLTGLLAVYRAAGLRLMRVGRGGWLVR